MWIKFYVFAMAIFFPLLLSTLCLIMLIFQAVMTIAFASLNAIMPLPFVTLYWLMLGLKFIPFFSNLVKASQVSGKFSIILCSIQTLFTATKNFFDKNMFHLFCVRFIKNFAVIWKILKKFFLPIMIT